ncbi:PspC domain-containing protein [Mucilaginibacter myungsuensis]|uniref:PspC domain-containing protein n=1 Tax=Mucilaginibacter myungsuensis TaxID=649104 RepID=A0A929L0S5_9SPHI|nr:PspC domain-containing protein [Mucilaginibacter myungsuensis]MBE9664135.1 PspC domain-containing protein [Mucilaginibacter myungsuensis]MDN3601314.1 PspC domain-containing protein [Mucilaginibacter myungsuensis]
MNKTIIININGIVFHIEEDAYEVLKSYMTDVKRHFMDSADSLEITTDIENRIAEMFNEILARESKQVIIEQDVKAVIAQMGTVEDFASAEEGADTNAIKDPFANIPASRRLFRDPDDHLIAGVCSGIANYFDIQAVWIRLAFFLVFWLMGTGLFLYIILWIVIPKAVTRADRMAMKGEKLDLQGFKRNFEDEMRNVGGTVKGMHHDSRPFVYKTRDFAGDFFDHLGAFLKVAGKVIVKLVGAALILMSIGFTIALIVMIFSYFVYGTDDLHNMVPFNFVNREYSVSFMFSAFISLIIPLIAILLLGVNLLLNRSVLNRTAGYTMLVCFFASVLGVTYYSVKVLSDLKASSKFTQTVNVTTTPSNTYYIKLNTVRHLSAEDSSALNIKTGFAGKIILDDDNNDNFDRQDSGLRNVRLEIERSDVLQPVLVESFMARGRDYADALSNARDITYQFSQKDGVLTFDRYMKRAAPGKPYRGQELRLTLKIPVNAKVIIDPGVDRILQNADIWRCNEDNKVDNDRPATFIMTADGLQCKVDTLVISKPKLDSVQIDTIVVKK